MVYYTRLESPIGTLYLSGEDGFLTSIFLDESDFQQHAKQDWKETSDEDILLNAKKQLKEYFRGERMTFDLPLQIKGTEFQKKVWEQLQAIPYGKTCSYQDIALAIDNINAVRAIGQANKANKFPIIIPCHRVIGKNRALTGYAGDQVDKKERLLYLENAL
ncbi:methylated-DNA--[protein]-cysteine S-methyltransferase [Falsibacillus albus]|uniref:Methylated-DNA--protein-cysteine methyltransferase n=1 Tax=Falsibacillus albus TaxID=2478915 RepID=A0A3L7KA39_9BACI|nr:methylated-DNA--[protein]-cysteine S-methyltransferase [Falsibacillus albus]RLQ97522.1 methylated-DNA--[protein]-cysteine S-methyltransferase [Falsibacillus albus]